MQVKARMQQGRRMHRNQKGDAMNDTPLQRTLIFLMRVSLGWVFLWAAMRQLTDPA